MSVRRPPLRPPIPSRLPATRFAGAALLGVGLVGAGLLGGCSEASQLGLGEMPVAADTRVAYRGPRLSRDESAQLNRCVALMTPMLRGEPVRSTAAARGGDELERLEYVWVNADMHDDADDIERRKALGVSVGGHCQFDDDGEAVHVHAYALAPQSEAQISPHAEATVAYRYVAAAGDTPVDSTPTAIGAD